MDRHVVHVLPAGEPMHRDEPFTEQPIRSGEARLQLRPLATDDGWVDVTAGPFQVAVEAGLEAQVEHDRDRRNLGLIGSTDECAPCRVTNIRGVDDRQTALAEPTAERGMERPECRPCRVLIVLALADPGPERIGGENLRRREVAGCEGRLSRSRGADEHDQRRVRELDLDRHEGMMRDAGRWLGGRRTQPRRRASHPASVRRTS